MRRTTFIASTLVCAAWLLPGLQVLWVNLHGGAALLGAGLVALKAADASR